ncbi:hypothetical protein ABPG75_007538 [Micractinium tetrahymenae]
MPRRRTLWLAVATALLTLAAGAAQAQKLRGYLTADEAAAAAQQLRPRSMAQWRAFFAAWKQQLGRTYAAGTAEDERRFWAWNGNMDAMLASNQRPGPFWKGLGEDFNLTELQAKYIRPVNPALVRPRSAGTAAGLALPSEWDWRARQAVPPIRPLRKDCRCRVGRGGGGGCAEQGRDQQDSRCAACLERAAAAGLRHGGTGFPLCGLRWRIPRGGTGLRQQRLCRHRERLRGCAWCWLQSSQHRHGRSVDPVPSPWVPPGGRHAAGCDGCTAVRGASHCVHPSWRKPCGLRWRHLPCQPLQGHRSTQPRVIVGYSQPKKVWIARNIWGTKWGEAGFFRLEMAASGLGACIAGATVPLATMRYPLPTAKLGPPPPRRPPPSPPVRRPPPPPHPGPPPPDVSSVPLSGFFGSSANATAAARELASMSADRKRLLYRSRWSGDDRRYRAWEARLENLTSWNNRTDVLWLKQLNNFFDYNSSELASIFLMEGVDPGAVRRRLPMAPPSRRRLLDIDDLPDQWDWRKLGAPGLFFSARQQGECGSCYAFAALGAMEAKAILDGTSKGPDLSEQQMVDCMTADPFYDSKGCEGGLIEEVFDYASSSYVLREDAYPYSGTLQECRVGSIAPACAMTLDPEPGYEVIPGDDIRLVKDALVNRAPLAAYWYTEDGFFSYDSGIYTAENCRNDKINHAVVIVGYGRDNKFNIPYWIIRNSWGDSWGDGG